MDRKKQKKKKNSSAKGWGQKNILEIIIFMTILSCIMKRVAIIWQIGIQGSAYFFSVYDVLVCFWVLLPVSLRQVVYKLVESRVSMTQYKNSFRVMYSAALMAVIYAIITIILCYSLTDFITTNFLPGNGGVLAYYIMIPTILFLGFSNVIRGFFEGLFSVIPSLFSVFLEQICMLLGIIIFSGLFTEYGEKISVVLANPENLYAYGAAGAAVGYLCGALVGGILSFVIFIVNKKSIRRKNRRDETRKNEDVYDLFVIIFKHLLPLGLVLLLVSSFEVFAQWIFFRCQNMMQEQILLSYQFGAYAGIYRTVILVPLLLIFAYSIRNINLLELGMRSGDFHEVRFKAFSMLKTAMAISFGFAAYSLVMAGPIVRGLFGLDSDLAIRFIRIGFAGILFMGFYITVTLILLGMGKNHACIMNGLISVFVYVILVFALATRTDMGIYSLIIGFLIYSALSAILSYFVLVKEMRNLPDVSKTFIVPFLSALAVGVVSLICNLIFGLFMPDILNAISVFIIFFISYYACLVKGGCFNAYEIENSKFGFILAPLGRILRIMH